VIFARINGNMFVMSFDRRFAARLRPGRRPSGNRSRRSCSARRRHDRRQLLPDVPLDYYAPWARTTGLTDRLALNVGVRWNLNSPVFGERTASTTGRHAGRQPGVAQIDRRRFPNLSGARRFGVRRRQQSKCPINGTRTTFSRSRARLNDKTVLRGGCGLYYINVVGISDSNAGISTPLITTIDDAARRPVVVESVLAGIASAPGLAGLETFLGRGRFIDPGFVNRAHRSRWACSAAAVTHDARVHHVGNRTREEEPMGRLQRAAGQPATHDPTKARRCPVMPHDPRIRAAANPFFQVPGFEGTTPFLPDAVACG
jgi:hypothetical protein